MALSMEKKQAILDGQAGSKLMVDAVKIPFEELQGRELTVEDYDRLGTDKPDENKHHFYAVTFAELPGSYTLSGSALTKLIDTCENPETGEDIRGEKIRIDKRIKLEGGRTFTPVVLI